jgi:hypothetical protein
MKRTFVRLAAVFLILTTLCSVLPAGAAAAATISPVVTSYEVHNRTNPSQKNLTMGNAADITFHFKDMSTTTDAAGSIDVTKLVDSFSTAANITATITSTGTDPLAFDVKVENVTYSGSGKGMTLMIAYAGTYTTISQNISEATEYTEPSTPDIDYTPDAAPAPMLIISRGDIKEPIKAGQEMEVTISIQNLSNLTLRTPLVKYTPSDSLMLTGGSSTFVLADIGAKKTVTTTVKIKALDTISSSQQSLGVALTYDYFNNVSTVQGSSSETVTIPAKATTGGGVTTPEPPVIVTRSAVSAISANQVFDLTITFKNAGTTKLVSPVATISTSEALVLQNDTSTFVLPDIEAGKSQSVTLKIKAASEISSTTQSVSADLRFSYDNGSGLVQASASERVNLAANVTRAGDDSQTASPVPNIIVEDFTFGGDSVAAGEPFSLNFTFKNTGRIAVENIVVLVDGGESFTMNGSTNTFYYDSLSAGGTLTQTVPMQTLATAKTGAQTVNVSFKYEYVDNKQRSSSSADIKLSVPVYQPDRLQIDEPTLYDMAYTGMETTITMSYVNKGKGDISNVEASISGDVDTLQATQYLGNFESGKSGNISFVVTPWNAGDVDLMITITYEDANAKTVTREFPMTLSVQDMNYDWGGDDIIPDEPVEPEVKTNWGLWIGVAAGGVVLVIVLMLLVRAKKKKSAARLAEHEWDDWDAQDDDFVQPDSDKTASGVGGKEE